MISVNMTLAFCKHGTWVFCADLAPGGTYRAAASRGRREVKEVQEPGLGRAGLGAGWPGVSPLSFLVENQACCPARGLACSCPGPRPGRELLQLPTGSRATGSTRSDTGLDLGSRELRGALVSQCS